jgi:hypothetical protein
MTACLLSKVYFVPTELLLVDPVVLSLLPAIELLLLEPQVNLLLRGLDTVGAMADVAANILQHDISQHNSPNRSRPGIVDVQ